MTPVLDPGVDYVDGYFPEGLWYDFYTVRQYSSPVHTEYTVLYESGTTCCVLTSPQGDSLHSKGEDLRLHAPLDKINLHLREGSVTPTQVHFWFILHCFFLNKTSSTEGCMKVSAGS